jgi:hypothetical protein
MIRHRDRIPGIKYTDWPGVIDSRGVVRVLLSYHSFSKDLHGTQQKRNRIFALLDAEAYLSRVRSCTSVAIRISL